MYNQSAIRAHTSASVFCLPSWYCSSRQRPAPPAPAHMLTAVKHGAVMVEIDLRNPNASQAQGEYAQFK